MRKVKLYQLLAVAGGLSVAVATTPVFAKPTTVVPLNWTAGTATVDGSISEWNLATDASTKMCTAGNIDSSGNCSGSGKVQLSTLYARYNCDTNTMYVLVLEAGNYEATQRADDAWVTVGGNSSKVVNGDSGKNGTPPDFAWVTVGGDFQGYEASFTLAAGTYNDVQVHLQVGSDTSSTGKNGVTRSITVPVSCTMPSVTPAPVVYDFTPPVPSGDPSPFDGNGSQCQVGGKNLNVKGRLLGNKSTVGFKTPSVSAEVVNNSGAPQQVTLVTYKEYYAHENYSNVLDAQGNIVKRGQTVYDYETVTVPVGVSQLEVDMPGCSTQIDLVCGPVKEYLGGGNLYNNSKLDWYHAHEVASGKDVWCKYETPPADTDKDGVADSADNCPAIANANQTDTDSDGMGDACDALTDTDKDGVADSADNCPNAANMDQADVDGDGTGDVCDATDDRPSDNSGENNDNGNAQDGCSSIVADNGGQMSLITKFEWKDKDNSYVREGGTDSIDITGDASGGDWSVNAANVGIVDVDAVIIKGSTGTYIYNYEPGAKVSDIFSKMNLPLNNGGQVPDISNVQFCQDGVLNGGDEVCLTVAGYDAPACVFIPAGTAYTISVDDAKYDVVAQ